MAFQQESCFIPVSYTHLWFGSGTPTYLIKMLDKFGVAPSEIGKREAVSYTHLDVYKRQIMTGISGDLLRRRC